MTSEKINGVEKEWDLTLYDGDLPQASERFQFLDGKTITKTLSVDVISGGR